MIEQDILSEVKDYFKLLNESNRKNCPNSTQHVEELMCQDQMLEYEKILQMNDGESLTNVQLKSYFRFSLQWELIELRHVRNEKIYPMNEIHFDRLLISIKISLNLIIRSSVGSSKNPAYLTNLDDIMKSLSIYEDEISDYFPKTNPKRLVAQRMVMEIVKYLNRQLNLSKCEYCEIGIVIHFLRRLIFEFDINHHLKTQTENILMDIVNLYVKLCRIQLRKKISAKLKQYLDVGLMKLYKSLLDGMKENNENKEIIYSIYEIIHVILVDLLPLLHVIWNKYLNRKPVGSMGILEDLMINCFNVEFLKNLNDDLSDKIYTQIIPQIFHPFNLIDIFINFHQNDKIVLFIEKFLPILNDKRISSKFSERFLLFLELNKNHLQSLKPAEETDDDKCEIVTTIDESLNLMYKEMKSEYDDTIPDYQSNQSIQSQSITIRKLSNEIISDENVEPKKINFQNEKLTKDKIEIKISPERTGENDQFSTPTKKERRKIYAFTETKILQTKTNLRTTPLKINPGLNGFTPVEVMTSSLNHTPSRTGSILKKNSTKFPIRTEEEQEPRNARIQFNDKLFFKIYEREEKDQIEKRINRFQRRLSISPIRVKRKLIIDFFDKATSQKKLCNSVNDIISSNEKENQLLPSE
ncbi:hypothetical protein SNEBB_009883 [Seison nebaliae]|nr:hypothetical protein SNEBB_009883 [Seison nebaliae]